MWTLFVSFQIVYLLSLPLHRGHFIHLFPNGGQKSRFHRKKERKKERKCRKLFKLTVKVVKLHACQFLRTQHFCLYPRGFTRNFSAQRASTWRKLSHVRRQKESSHCVFCRRAAVTASRTMHNLTELLFSVTGCHIYSIMMVAQRKRCIQEPPRARPAPWICFSGKSLPSILKVTCTI